MTERKTRSLDAEKLWEYALRALAGRASSAGEIREKLRRRAARAADVDEILTRLKDCGYLNDRRFAEAFANARLTNDGLGRARVVRELRARRVAPSLAETAAKQAYQGVDERNLIEDFIRRKYRLAERDGLFQDDKDMAKAYGRLRRAGFRSGEILAALKKFARTPELLDAWEPPEEEEEPPAENR
ncbi:MAG TPA: RecX family transcriptional regulator [Bryobacteraceae bacterium]|nr:RecX family transcriptional regulator [Bryobacteraceae bacterium]